ncbi:hypothetical protein YB2330_002196 [Saitoella coloradoensis]
MDIDIDMLEATLKSLQLGSALLSYVETQSQEELGYTVHTVEDLVAVLRELHEIWNKVSTKLSHHMESTTRAYNKSLPGKVADETPQKEGKGEAGAAPKSTSAGKARRRRNMDEKVRKDTHRKQEDLEAVSAEPVDHITPHRKRTREEDDLEEGSNAWEL